MREMSPRQIEAGGWETNRREEGGGERVVLYIFFKLGNLIVIIFNMKIQSENRGNCLSMELTTEMLASKHLS